MAPAKKDELTSYKISCMETDLKEMKSEMATNFEKIFARFDSMEGKYPSMREHFENKEKIKALENKVEGINMKIASWTGSIIIIMYFVQQFLEKWK